MSAGNRGRPCEAAVLFGIGWVTAEFEFASVEGIAISRLEREGSVILRRESWMGSESVVVEDIDDVSGGRNGNLVFAIDWLESDHDDVDGLTFAAGAILNAAVDVSMQMVIA